MKASGLLRKFSAAAAFLGLLYAAPTFAAQPVDTLKRNLKFVNLTTEDGLSSEFVTAVAQDGQGYLWFATQSGLNRYDGHEVRVYEHRPDQPNSISDNFLRALLVDHQGELWVGTGRGLNRYDAATDSFEQRPFGGQLADLRIRAVTQDDSGRFWVGTVASGLFAIDRDGSNPRHYRHEPDRPDSLPSDQVITLLESQTGEVWVGTDGGGLARLDREQRSFTVYRHEPDDPTSLAGDEIRSIFEDRDGFVWVGSAQGGLSRYDPTTDRFERFAHSDEDPLSLGTGQVPAIFEDRDGTLWVGTEAGLSEWRPARSGFVTYRRDRGGRYSLVNDRVNAISQDASGVLWVATHGGVSAWNYVSDTFFQYNAEGGFVASDIVTSVAQSQDGHVWVATYGGGVSRINMEDGAVRQFRHQPGDATSLSDDRVMAVYVDQADQVWAGTRDGGLCRLVDEARFSCYQHDPADSTSLSGNAVTRVYSDRNGDLWVGVFGGGLNQLRWEGDRAQFRHFRHDPENPATLSSDRVLAMAHGPDGYLWVGTESGGLNRLDLETGRVLRFDIEPYATNSGVDPVSGSPWELYFSEDGSLWIGTMSQGLLRWSARDRAANRAEFERFGLNDGLTSGIYGIVPGDDGKLWLSSSQGLFGFDPKRRTVRKFDRSNGLRNNEFNVGARLKTQSGELIFGGTAGLVAFSPKALPFNATPPPIALAARSRRAVLARNGDGGTPQVSITYHDPFVAFDFVALDFVSPDKNAYRYRLEGYDSDWNDATQMRTAVYTNLPAGSYTFRVNASNSNGVWNQEGAAIALTVSPAPWATSWAYLGYAFTAAALLLWMVRRQKKKRMAEIEQRVKLELLVAERTSELETRNTELQALNRKIEDASLTDQLTGLRNRRFIHQFIDSDLSTIERNHYRSQQDPEARIPDQLLFVIMIDLDRFKPVNDRLGHDAGDLVLQMVSDRLTSCCRASDTPVRWGGDEFLLVGYTETFEGIETLAEKVRVALGKTLYDLHPNGSASLSASIGVSALPFVDGQLELASWEHVLGAADVAAYLAKNNGGNSWVSIRGTHLLESKDLIDLKDDLSSLVDAGRISVNSSLGGKLRYNARSKQERKASVVSG